MIKFFRKIRQNLLSEGKTGKTGKYMKYALGEIVLVVIGILIALQINNWNEKRKRHVQADNFLKSMISDLASDTVTINTYVKFLDRLSYNRATLLNTQTVKNIPIDSLIDLFQPRYDEIKINDQTFQKMKSIGLIELPNHKNLMDSITFYYTRDNDMFNSNINWEVEFSKKDAEFWYYNKFFESPYLSDEFTYLDSELRRKSIFDSLINTVEVKNRIRTSLFRKRHTKNAVLNAKEKSADLILLIKESLDADN
ncbi:DUF6090 family protein [Mangrovimonas aestuarii]|uniref:DUF6090 family protein n=1 Tax=Mangrovimonas aestuarii TaxID=3018443 RepID=UPI002378017C|nr:DUF6090 family protein [Mangrovimonas aestuarii]